MSEAMYKIVSADDFNAYTTETDDDGNEYKNYTCKTREVHPSARLSPDGTEYVISCNCGDGTHTLTEIKEYMADSEHWIETEEEVVL